jgi:hypothetical protein
MPSLRSSKALLLGSAIGVAMLVGLSLLRLARASLRAEPCIEGWIARAARAPPEALAQWENEGGAARDARS